MNLVIDEPLGAADSLSVAPPTKPTDERITPQWLFDALDEEFRFVWDLAATRENAKAHGDAYFGPDHPDPAYRDGLAVDWAEEIRRAVPFGPVAAWLNPPYSRGQILKWCEKCEHESAKGLTIVALLPADTSTEYWHRYIRTGERRTLRMRLKFAGAPLDRRGQLPPAKFGSVIRIWRPTHRYWSFD